MGGHLQVADLACAYPGAAAPVLSGVSIDFPPGSLTTIAGPSGTGKSTLLRALARFEPGTTGTMTLDGQDALAMDGPSYRTRVTFVHQMPVLLPGTIRHNVLLPYTFGVNAHRPPPSDTTLCELLARVQLDCTPDADAESLSVGQRQRVCLVRALALDPEVLLLDEPAASLDPASARTITRIITEFADSGTTVVMVSHNESDIEHAARLVRVANGTAQLVA